MKPVLMRRRMTEPIAAPAAVRAAVPVTAAALATLAVAAGAGVVAFRQMKGMDMGAETELGSFASFVGFWMAMMAAMMLPGAAVAVFRRARVRGVPLFVGAYLAVWTLVGVAAYTLDRPHGSLVAGALTVAAGLELAARRSSVSAAGAAASPSGRGLPSGSPASARALG